MVYDADAFLTPPDLGGRGIRTCPAADLDGRCEQLHHLGRLVSRPAQPYQPLDAVSEVKQKLIEQKKLLLSYFAGFDEGVNMFRQNNIKGDVFDGRAAGAGPEEEGVNAALAIIPGKARSAGSIAGS